MPAVGVDQGSIAFMQPALCLALLSVSFSFSLDCFCLRMRIAVCCYIALISLCGSSCTALLQPCSAHAKGASSGQGNIPAVGVDQGTPHNYPNGTLLGPAHLMTCKPCSPSFCSSILCCSTLLCTAASCASHLKSCSAHAKGASSAQGYMPAVGVDQGPIAFRTWLRKHGGGGPAVANILDPTGAWLQHVR